MSDHATKPAAPTTASEKATTTDSSVSEDRMRPTVRRGPRYRSPVPRPSVPYRGSVNDLVMAATGLSAAQAHRLRFQWPGLIAKAVQRLREAGEIQAAAQLLARIEEAAGTQLVLSLPDAIHAEQEAEAACDVAETAALLEPSAEREQLALRASAVEIRLQIERDALRRRELAERHESGTPSGGAA